MPEVFLFSFIKEEVAPLPFFLPTQIMDSGFIRMRGYGVSGKSMGIRIDFPLTQKKMCRLTHLSLGCGGRTRTCDLQVMSLASYQLLHPAIYALILLNECKGTSFYPINKINAHFFL